MKRTELEKKVIEIVSRYTYTIVTIDSDIRNDLGLDSMDEADLERDLESEFNICLRWIEWDSLWRCRPNVKDLCDFLHKKQSMKIDGYEVICYGARPTKRSYKVGIKKVCKKCSLFQKELHKPHKPAYRAMGFCNYSDYRCKIYQLYGKH